MFTRGLFLILFAISVGPSLHAATRSAVLFAQMESIQFYAFEETSKSCDFRNKKMQEEITALFRKDSEAARLIRERFGESFRSWNMGDLSVFLDDLGAQKIQHSALFLRDYPTPGASAIVLNCDPSARKYWAHSVAHELSHFQMAHMNVDSWYEEGVAQLIELESGGIQPTLSVEKLARTTEPLPALLENSRPLGNLLSYPMSLLFLRYISDQFGGDAVIYEMIKDTSSSCEQSQFWARAVCRGAKYVEARKDLANKKMRFTEKGLIRYFAVALGMNHSSDKVYSISDWSGFYGRPRFESGPMSGGKIAFLTTNQFRKSEIQPSQDIEIYRLQSSDSTFQIFPFSQMFSSDAEKGELRNSTDSVLVIGF